ncbi:PREDICTED: GDSL esterase/lipase At1g28590-like isoform X2 [Prunus mume]|uniref:GDSL esterase/lipase At1g28590-like isoform X2 n=1 Tax=Prunus mume TaxID=102107 RepID=A0ABM1LMD5_PRUMU|nr:PREDICTED: GDSL esterase/lipase At1g28590-like isoform X2 [Prunus mume]
MSSMGWSFQAYLMNLILILILIPVIIIPLVLGCYNSIIAFGDSLTDTGNLYNSYPNKSLNFFHPPYGQTYFHHPTGRCSDGRLVIDFIAEFLGLPLVPPYLESQDSNQSVQNFEAGVNFAVVGATALDAAFLEEMGDSTAFTNNSLSIQLEWFKQMLPSLCNTSSDCNKLLSTSLILMGEIGGNDYNNALLAGKSIEKVQAYVPLVIETIASTINELIELGAATLLVPGNFPIGCLPAYLTKYESSDKNQYDPSTGCLNWLNKFSGYHNDQLQIELSRIRRLHPQVTIIYADYYNAMLQLYQSPDQFGFTGETSKACCGGGGPYNFNSSVQCGNAGATVCENPSQFINWDGMHCTEAAYRLMTKALLQGNYTFPRLASLCVSQM